MAVNTIVIIILIILAVIGSIIGFGRALKISTNGVAGVIISVVVCFLIGGALLATPAISNLVYRGNNYFNDVWRFLGIIRLGTIIYFIVLFAIVQILRMIIVYIIKSIVEINNTPIRVVNKILGAVYVSGTAFLLMLLIFAALSLIDQTTFAQSVISSMEGNFLHTLFINNPIVFGGSNTANYYPAYSILLV